VNNHGEMMLFSTPEGNSEVEGGTLTSRLSLSTAPEGHTVIIKSRSLEKENIFSWSSQMSGGNLYLLLFRGTPSVS
jgi:hypothetical protein